MSRSGSKEAEKLVQGCECEKKKPNQRSLHVKPHGSHTERPVNQTLKQGLQDLARRPVIVTPCHPQSVDDRVLLRMS